MTPDGEESTAGSGWHEEVEREGEELLPPSLHNQIKRIMLNQQLVSASGMKR
jgi:hypothetical protein